MERRGLQTFWERLFGKPPNPALRREILVPILAYRLQEVALGGLKALHEKRLCALTKDGHRRLGAPSLRPKAGTQFMREWQGKLHEVAVLPDGFEYNGHTYRSLSEIARAITGTRWSGPAFFGLKRRGKEMAT